MGGFSMVADFDQELEALADEWAKIALAERDVENKMLSPEAKIARFKEEFKEAMSLKETEIALEQAIVILNIEGADYPDQAKVQAMAREFTRGLEQLKNSANVAEDEFGQTIQERAQISDSALQLVEEIAKKKFSEGEYAASKALFLFLTVLNSKRFDYWQSLGMTELELKEYENAIVAFENGWLIRQDVIANRLFLAECYIQLQEPQKASEFVVEAKRLISDQGQQEQWSEYIAALEQVDGFKH